MSGKFLSRVTLFNCSLSKECRALKKYKLISILAFSHINRLKIDFHYQIIEFEHRTVTEHVHLLGVELEHQFLPLNTRTSNFEHCSTLLNNHTKIYLQ